jgi:predicted GIY-YIG superfamily endonuclease
LESVRFDGVEYYVYIMASERQTLYTGVTSDLESRVWLHRTS